MYQNQLIFNAVFSKGQIYTGSKPDGDVYQKQAEISIGYIQGDKREIRAGMTDNVLESDNWLLFNVLDADNIYHESVAILGVASVDEGAYYTQRYFAETLGANMQSVFVGEYPVKVLKRFLDSATAIQNVRIKPEAVERFYNVLTTETPVWDDDVLLSHSGSVRALVADMVANDDNNELLDTMDKLNFAQFIQDFNQLDALFTDVTGLSKLARQLTIAIDKKGTDKVSLDRITQSEKPFKRNGMTNLALNLSMTDGQTVTILFYNPDNTPSKLLPNDILTSWKWILNNRDVTAVLQPETGKDVNIPALASRIMQLVEKNHNRFVRNKAKLEKENAKLADLTETVTQKENIIAELDKEIAEWQAKVDELLKNPVTKEESNDKSETAQESEQNEAIAQNEQATDEPIVLTGKEFGEFDLTTDDGKKALRETVVDYLDNLRGQTVFCKALNADVEIRKKGIKKYLSTSSNPIKLQIAGSLLDIIKNGKVFKPSVASYADKEQSHGVKYHYLKTPFVINGTEYGARVVIREDKDGKFHYDLQVRNAVDAILDGIDPIKNPSVPNFQKALAVSDLPSIVYEDDDVCQVKDVSEMLDSFGLQKNSPREFQLYDSALDCLGLNVDYTEELMEIQDSTMLDSTDSKMVLNLFIFDENGNEIDDLVQDKPQPAENAPAYTEQDYTIKNNNGAIAEFKSEHAKRYDVFAGAIQVSKKLSDWSKDTQFEIVNFINRLYQGGRWIGHPSELNKQILRRGVVGLGIKTIPRVLGEMDKWWATYAQSLRDAIDGYQESSNNRAYTEAMPIEINEKGNYQINVHKDLIFVAQRYDDKWQVRESNKNGKITKMTDYSDIDELVQDYPAFGKLPTIVEQDLPQDEPQQPVENPQNNDIDDNQDTGEPKNNTDKLKGEPKYEYRPHGKDLTFVGQEFDHTPTGDTYTVWGVAKGEERWGVAIAVETINMGKKITTQELAQKVADVMAQRFDYTQLEIRSDRAFLGGGVSAISNAFGAGGLTKPVQENKNQDTQAELTKQMNEPNETNPDLDYLTDMANGKIKLTVQNMKEHILKLKEIAIALDGKHDDLLNQAIEVYQQFALSVKVQ